MPRDLLAEQNEPRDLLANVQQPEDNNELSFRQGIEPDYIDKVFSFFRDPQKEKARATLALVDSEALGINPHTAYNAKKGIDKYYDIDPTRKKAKEDKLQRIKAFNDMGGEEEEWHTLFLRNVQKLPYHMMDAAGNWIRMFEESPEAAFAMTGATPSEEDLQTFKLATEAIEKKKVRTLGDDIAGAAKEKIKSLTPATAPDSWKDTVHMAGDSVMTNLVWLIPGFKYGKAASLTGMGWQATGQTYGEQREGGSDPGTAFAAATIGGMSEVLSEFIPVGIYLKPKASLVRSLVAAELTEIPTEMANQVVQDVVDKVTIRPDMTIEDMIDNLTQTIQVTALSTLALSGMSYSANKAIGKATKGTEHADTFNQAKNKALRDGKTPQEAVKEGIEAVKSTPEGQTFVDQKEAEIKQAAKDYKPTENKTPFIIGVNDENGEVTSFTMADPISGQTFDVPAIDKSGDKEGATVKFIPDPKAINEALSRIREPEEIDTKIDKIIEGNEDIDKVVNQIFGEDVPDFESEEDTTTPEKTEPAASKDNPNIFYSGLDISQTLDVLKGLTQNIKEAIPHLEALGRHIYESGKVKFNEWSASMKETLGDLWESFKDIMQTVFNKLKEERGSISNKDAVNADPLFEIAKWIKDNGGLNYDSLIVDWGKEDVGILMKKRPGVVRKDGALKLDEVAQEWDTNDNDLMMDLLSNKSKKEVISQVSMKSEEEYLKTLYDNEQVSRAEFTRAVNKARIAFQEGNAAELKRLKNSIKWMAKRKETLKNVRDYFGLTDTEMSKISRKNPLLMDDVEFKQYLQDVNLKAIDLRDNKWAKIELMNLVEQKRLQKVDNYRRALELPSIDKMTTDQLRQFAKLLEPFQNDDIFLTQRELETVDRTDLKGIKTWREARERLAKEAGVPIEELAKVKVAWNENFKWDSSLREQDPFFDLLVTKMTESMMGAEMKVHNVESKIYDLAKKAEKSRKRGIVERMIPQDELIFQYLEAPQAEKNAVAQQMTPEQLRMAHFMNQYFANALNYLIAIKTVEHGRQNYITHIRKSFMENMRDKGIKEAITGLFTAYQEDQIGFNILDDDTGNILPLEKFFQFSLHRTGELDPTKNVTRAFMTYVAMFEKKKAFDAIIPKLDIYTQSLTPVKYTPRGLEFDRSLKTFVNKWINNKKGRKISYDSAIRQGGVLDLGIRALRTITTMIDLGFYVPAQIINFMGEQITTMVPLGYKEYAKSIALMRTVKGKRILKKYEFFTERSLWEEFTAPGKEIQQRLMDGMFGLFHISTVAANKQFLLASMTKEEWANEELSPERLAKIKLDMGRFRAIPGTNSLVGSTSLGGSAMQYKAWAVGPTRTLIKDITTMAGKLKKKQYGEAFTSEEARELYRIVGTTMAVIAVTSLAGDDDDDSFIGKMKARAKREVFTLTQGMDPTFWLSWRSLSYLTQLGTALKNLLFLEEYETKEGLKGVNQLKKAVTPGMIRALPDEEE